MRARRSIPVIVATGVVGLVALVAGCAPTPFSDDSFEQKIPAAIEDASFSVTHAEATQGVDGFVTYLFIGIDLAEQEFSAEQLREVLRIVADNNTLGAEQIRFGIKDADGDFIELKPLLNELGVDDVSGYGDNVSWEDLRRAASAD